MTVEVGPFRLIDPPEGMESIIREAYAAIDFPWERFAVPLARDTDKAIVVEWDDTGQGVSGLAYGYSLRIVLSTRAYHMDAGAAFVFAHEVGHLVDYATLRDEDRTAIMAVMHDGNYIQIGHFDHDHKDAGHAHEEWTNGEDSYVSRINECYADQFVAAFAPRIWNGDEAHGWRQRHPRFVHWTDDHEAIRRLTLWQPPPPQEEDPEMSVLAQIKDVSRKHRKARAIARAVNLGLMDVQRGRFYPGRRVTRAQLAEALVRLHDKD